MSGNPSGKDRGLTRRSVLAGAAAIGVGVGIDRVVGNTGGRAGLAAGSESGAVPFYDARQAGIATPAQEFVELAAFDVTSDASDDLRGLLQAWTEAGAALTAGRPYEARPSGPGQPPTDTGEAVGLGPARLAITVGFGPSLFGSKGSHLGLARLRPSALRRLPPFRGESLDPALSGGDLCVQACADDPQVAFHAIHVFTRIAGEVATLRWSQQGFGRTSATTRSQATTRNLMGFKDGTDNIRAEDDEAMDRFVWVQRGDGPSWMEGGSYLILRRIQMLFDVWDATSLEGQERVFGRKKLSGAPLGERKEYDPVDLSAKSNGELTIPANAHIRLASPSYNDGQRILRRGYSYAEPPEPGSGQIDAGLLFICFQRDPQQFIRIQRQLAGSDALNHHTLHTASAIFACPPGAKRGGFVGDGLFS
ncbi:MAG TPA: iron uptake transporter deferrochelatase/peroxidase subunit [Solirubrobacteraceae bacterium]|nr:iron uptake transporter deferrochelatase/peroxidase subunit [Solirubrobacteraceae bacterium]